MNRYQRRALREKRRAKLSAGMTMVAELTAEDRLEKEEQWEIVKLCENMGCKVYSLSQPRATMQTEGISDLYVFCERKRRAFWIETKRPIGGVESKDQKEFGRLCDVCNVDRVIGSYSAVYAHLQAMGVILT